SNGMPGTIPSWVAAGATTEPAPSENPEPSAYDADHTMAFGTNASWRSSSATPPETPGCSASCNASTCLRCIQRPVTSTGAPATSITSWAASTARRIVRVQPGPSARVAPTRRMPPHHAAITSPAITDAQRAGACHGSPQNDAPTRTGSWYAATVTMLISPGLALWLAGTCRALAAANREIMNAISAVAPHGTSVTGRAPIRTLTPLLSSQSKVPDCSAPPRLAGAVPSQPRTATPAHRIQLVAARAGPPPTPKTAPPAHRIQLVAAVAAAPTSAMTGQLLGGEEACATTARAPFFRTEAR